MPMPEIFNAELNEEDPTQPKEDIEEPKIHTLDNSGDVFSFEDLRNLEILDLESRVSRWIYGLETIARCPYEDMYSEERNSARVYNNVAYEMEQEMVFSDIRPKKMNIRTRIGNYGRTRLLAALAYHAPYTDDEHRLTGGVFNRIRFEVRDVTGRYYIVCDHLYGAEIEIPKIYPINWTPFALGKYYSHELRRHLNKPKPSLKFLGEMFKKSQRVNWGPAWEQNVLWLLNSCYDLGRKNSEQAYIIDYQTSQVMEIEKHLLSNEEFDPVRWVHRRINRHEQSKEKLLSPEEILSDLTWFLNHIRCPHVGSEEVEDEEIFVTHISIEAFGQQVEMGTYPSLQRNASARKDTSRSVPRPLVVVVNVNGHPARALIDTGSLGDFMSANLAAQLSVRKVELTNPVNVNMAVQGSCTKVNYGTRVKLTYQEINEERYFDIMNLSNYDLILGTPFLFQHKVNVCLEPPTVIKGSKESLPLAGNRVAKLASRVAAVFHESLDKVRSELKLYAEKLCIDTSNTPLPPLREINHEIPLIDPHATYHWRPSRCPEAFRPLWNAKRDAYVKTGRWVMKPARNAVPMLLIPKPRKEGEPPKLRTVVDLRERNRNTRKMSSPLPEIDGILRRVAGARYRSSIDLADAYEQIRVKPEHVERTAMTTPDGTMLSQVMQQGDCNASATFQLVMTRIFGPYIGKFLEVYLDDLIIYSETLEDHITHIKLVIDILEKEKFYLSAKKLHFLEQELRILGRVVTDEGIHMDPDKVDALAKWKTPTNRDLLRDFLGSAGHLADDIDRVRIPMGILSELTGDTVPFRWEFTHQRAFQDVKDHAARWMEKLSNFDFEIVYVPGTENILSDALSRIYSNDQRGTVRARSEYTYHDVIDNDHMPAGLVTMPVIVGLEGEAELMTIRRSERPNAGRNPKYEQDFFAPKGRKEGGSRGANPKRKQEASHGRTSSVRTRTMPPHGKRLASPNTANAARRGLSSPRSKTESRLGSRRISQYQIKEQKNGPRNKKLTLQSDSNRKARLDLKRINQYHRAQQNESRNEKLTIRIPARAPALESNSPQPDTLSNPSYSFENAKDASLEATNVGDVSTSVASARSMVDGVSKEDDKRGQTDTYAPISSEPDDGITPPSLLDVLDKGRDNVDLLDGIRGKYTQDSMFKIIITRPKEYKNFDIENGLIFLKQSGSKLPCIPNIIIDGRNVREIVISETHSLLAHLGSRKTLAYLRDHVWWKDMVRDVSAFCETCVTCKRSKPNNHAPYGLLNPLHVPTVPWEIIGMDFVGPLPESKDRNANFD
ncbi:hypothetical protein NP233_g2799 [Leucocoprinus birnbaumii]|uniref:Reverse transcriptase domain-containing protein n=1 Tax=Leucocoprinus birnbaumii TaxID=56174 RepID=A0AAD5YYG1_9AGAR|nr:hypothetical protein NP233_g2799 [Leucocoprinus birnbaumii]